MTDLMRKVHRERVMTQFHLNCIKNNEQMSFKPDFPTLLSKKFSSLEEEPELKAEEAYQAVNNDIASKYGTE